ncbi:SLBB domain-containing protein [Roseateles cellulosilyticus]|uniref:SLBB domain-containing protein n=1 Tax=Pelomonas cellulosilytica TaxID=2906762 RepID=A0ABS8Y2Q6_9BURK|nr:SLBB domain-containing protein [Pelomonas sp. P8]MCE4558033.1 SLBB domain-containing protein [Pelomonas sp. P8]
MPINRLVSHLRWHPFPVLFAAALLASTAPAFAASDTTTDANRLDSAATGPVRLGPAQPRSSASSDESVRDSVIDDGVQRPVISAKAAAPSEFEAYASEMAGVPIQRLGSDLMLPTRGIAAIEANRQVPPDYIVGLGDEIQLTIWGSVDADLRLTVDRAGRIVIPRVGPVVVAGVRHADLNELLTRRVGQVFKNFQLSATLGRLRSIRFYVTGFVERPGAYSVSSLATVMTGLVQAGGPAKAGSFRNIELRRNGQTVGRFDLYDLLVRGEKRGDMSLQADDVLYVGPIGPQVALIGSVNRPAIVELKGNETVNDAIGYVGGLSTVADIRRVAVERLSERNDRRVVELALPQDGSQRMNNGDIVRAFNSVAAALPQAKQYKRIRVEGEVGRPGDYVLPPTSTLVDAVQAAGGLTAQAYLFGTDLSRESVRKVQEAQYDRALRDLETDFTRNASTQRVSNAEDAAAVVQKQAGTTRLIERLRAVRPTGRVVLDLTNSSREVPTLMVEDGDRLYIPARPNTVGVFGSVFNGGSYLLKPGNSLEDIVKLAGGPTRGADTASMFVLRANGSVVSARQSSSGWLSGNSLSTLAALPGDTVFVPEELNKTTFMQEAKDWTQILYQFGIGAAALKTIKN